MPRTRSLAWSELKIGLLTITAIVIAAVLIMSLTGAKGWFWQRYMLKTRFPNVAGLAAGSPVRVAGVQVGLADQRGRLELLRAAGHRHGHRQTQRGEPKRRQCHRGGGVGPAGLVTDRRALGRRHPRPAGPGQGDDLEILRARSHIAHLAESTTRDPPRVPPAP